MNLKAHHPDFKVWAGAQADVDRILAVWRQCFDAYGGPFLFGAPAHHRRRDVRAGVHAVPHLRRRARRHRQRRTATRSWPCPRWSSGSPPRTRSPTSSRSSTSSSRPRTGRGERAQLAFDVAGRGVAGSRSHPRPRSPRPGPGSPRGSRPTRWCRASSPASDEHLRVARHHVGDVTLVHRQVTLTLGAFGLDARRSHSSPPGMPAERVGERLPDAVVAHDVPRPEGVGDARAGDRSSPSSSTVPAVITHLPRHVDVDVGHADVAVDALPPRTARRRPACPSARRRRGAAASSIGRASAQSGWWIIWQRSPSTSTMSPCNRPCSCSR